MTQSDEPAEPSRYMALGEVQHHLRLKSPGSVRNKIYKGELVGVNITTLGKSQLRVTRKSFEDYCDRIEREAAERFGEVNV